MKQNPKSNRKDPERRSLLTVLLLTLSLSCFCQQITLKTSQANLKDALKEIRDQSGYDFLYTNAVLEAAKPIDINIADTNIEHALNVIFDDQPLIYNIQSGKTIVIEVQPTATRNLQ